MEDAVVVGGDCRGGLMGSSCGGRDGNKIQSELMSGLLFQGRTAVRLNIQSPLPLAYLKLNMRCLTCGA